jgi:hypothetical protein
MVPRKTRRNRKAFFFEAVVCVGMSSPMWFTMPEGTFHMAGICAPNVTSSMFAIATRIDATLLADVREWVRADSVQPGF